MLKTPVRTRIHPVVLTASALLGGLIGSAVYWLISGSFSVLSLVLPVAACATVGIWKSRRTA